MSAPGGRGAAKCFEHALALDPTDLDVLSKATALVRISDAKPRQPGFGG